MMKAHYIGSLIMALAVNASAALYRQDFSVDKVLIDADANNGSFELNTDGLLNISPTTQTNNLQFWTGNTAALGTRALADTRIICGLNAEDAAATEGVFLATIGVDDAGGLLSGDTGYVVKKGDLFSLSFDYQGGAAWQTSGELEYFLYTEADRNAPILAGTISNFTQESGLSFATNLTGSVSSLDVGQNLIIEFNCNAGTNQICFIDNVQLAVRYFPQFYDDSCETYTVATNVMGFGATHNGTNDNDSAAFQAGVDYLASQGGGYLDVPAGTYALDNVELTSDIHIRIDKDATLYGYVSSPTKGFTMFTAKSGSGTPVENISIRGVGGRFTFDLPDGHNGTRTVGLNNVKNFLLSDWNVDGGGRAYSTMVFSVEGFGPDSGGYPHQGTVQNISGYKMSAGYGLLQTQAASSILYTNLYGEGGATLRLETGWDRMEKYEFGGVFDIFARDITAVSAKGAIMLGPHSMHNGVINADGLTAINCDRGVSAGNGFVKQSLNTPGLTPGGFAEGTIIRNVDVTFGMTAQYEKTSELDDLAEEYKDDIVYYDNEVDDCSARAPALYPSKILSDTVTLEGVRAHGFKYQPPVRTHDDLALGFSDEIFSSAEYSTNLNGEFWSVYPSVAAGQTNWLHANGSEGIMEMTTAEENHHALNYWGFDIPAEQRLIIRSDFRYNHPAGGERTASLNEAAFGLLVSTDADAAAGTNRFCSLANRGGGIGFAGSDEDMVAHASLGIDTDAGGWSDWVTLKWQIQRGSTDYTATPRLYDAAGTLLLAGASLDLGIPNGTTLFAGYSTGTNGVGGTVAALSGFSEVQLDHFKFERDQVDMAPAFLDSKIVRADLSPNVAFRSTLAADASDENGDDITFSKVSGPDWLTVWYDGTISGTPGTNDVGSHVATVQVAGSGGSSTADLYLTVHPLPELIQKLDSDADAYVAGDSNSNAIYGAYSPMSLRDSDNEKFLREGYMRFDLSEIDASSITKALLRLKLKGPGTKNHEHSFQFVADDSWEELELKWVNKPAASNVLGVASFPATEPWVEVDLTEQVQTELAGDKMISLKIVSGGSDSILYYTKEAELGLRPELVVYTLADGWAEFAYDHGLSVSTGADADDDGQSDLYEYAFGGNPTNASVQGDALRVTVDAAQAWLVCSELNDAGSGITYTPEWTDDLVEGVWSNCWDETRITPSVLPDYNEVERLIEGPSPTFFRLRVSAP